MSVVSAMKMLLCCCCCEWCSEEKEKSEFKVSDTLLYTHKALLKQLPEATSIFGQAPHCAISLSFLLTCGRLIKHREAAGDASNQPDGGGRF